MDKKKLILGVAILVLIVGGLAFWYSQKKEVALLQSPLSSLKEPDDLGAQIFESTENPIKDRVPDTNPFSADTNPFDAKTNPFKDEYKNPF